MITATATVGNSYVKVEFDSIEWFEQATEEQIIKVVEENMGGLYNRDEITDGIVEFMEDKNHQVRKFLECKNLMEQFGHEYGWACKINYQEFFEWLEENKLELFNKIMEENEG